jgi:membrane associated rhomboid family serine protease
MLIPLSDAPNPGGRPYVTYGLIALNVLVYLLVSLPLSSAPADPDDPALGAYIQTVREQLPPGVPLRAVLNDLSSYELYVFEHGYKPANPQVTDLFYSLFLHGGFMHLFGNMLFLWIYGDNVEYRLGHLAYLFWYLATGVAATLFFALFASGSSVPLVGASGAISGVLGFYFLWFPRNTVRMFVFLFPFFMNVVAIRARIVLGIYLVLDNLLPFVLAGSDGGGVAHGAHIGGFVAGIAVAWILDRRPASAAAGVYAVEDRTGPAVVDASSAGGALAEPDMARAASAYFKLPADRTTRALPAEDSLALGNWLAREGHMDAAHVVFRRHLRDYPTGPTAAAAHVGLGLVQLDHRREVAPAYQHFLDALDLNPDADTAARARAALARIAALQKYNIGRRPQA